jgi:hypothetical protein
MPRYSAFIALDTGPGHYQELDELIEASDPRTAAQVAIELMAVHPDDEFPVILIVEEGNMAVFSRDDDGQPITPDEDWPRLLARGPGVVNVYPPKPMERVGAYEGPDDGARPHSPDGVSISEAS